MSSGYKWYHSSKAWCIIMIILAFFTCGGIYIWNKWQAAQVFNEILDDAKKNKTSEMNAPRRVVEAHSVAPIPEDNKAVEGKTDSVSKSEIPIGSVVVAPKKTKGSKMGTSIAQKEEPMDEPPADPDFFDENEDRPMKAHTFRVKPYVQQPRAKTLPPQAWQYIDSVLGITIMPMDVRDANGKRFEEVINN